MWIWRGEERNGGNVSKSAALRSLLIACPPTTRLYTLEVALDALRELGGQETPWEVAWVATFM